MLIGVPGSGKSTWIQNQNFDWNHTMVASTDDEVEQMARKAGKTYDEVFRDAVGQAQAVMMNRIHQAVRAGTDIVWDQTNTSVVSRRKKLLMIPKRYKKVAVVFPTPGAVELGRRLASRPGKTIPDNVMQGMINSLQLPSKEEGFDEIITV